MTDFATCSMQVPDLTSGSHEHLPSRVRALWESAPSRTAAEAGSALRHNESVNRRASEYAARRQVIIPSQLGTLL